MLKASVLIVGDDRQLLCEQTALLSDCEVVTTYSKDAEEAIRALAVDLLIIGETVPNAAARMMLALAGKLHPQLKILLVGRQHREWHLGSAAFYTVTSIRPCELEAAVTALLACDQSQPAQIARLRKMVS
jgi:DNA-binding NarL/FixJ family response regulator